ncbi:MAG: 50S ribosomal protein L32 [Candidatus Sungbacteria bacterium]|nr:50S ribosomal protein L32 [Candidatus Sungbacteria bacterium]
MVVRMRHTKSATGQRRSHHALRPGAFSICSHCNKDALPHTVCQNCGYYKGRQVIDVLAKLDKKTKKKKEKELHAHEQTEEAKKKDLSAEELSHR